MRHRRVYINAAKISIALLYGIPLSQAHTINIDKVQEYEIHRQTAEQRLESFLDDMADRHLKRALEGSWGTKPLDEVLV